MRYKIDFGPVFLLCIITMIFGYIWTLLGDRPEAFVYGNIIYEAVAGIFYILTNLAIGIAGAIVFYFMAQYLDINKNFESYADLRADTLSLLYTHMMILKDIKEFEGLNNDRNADFFYSLDVPILIEGIRKISLEEEKSQFKNNLKEYFLNTPKERLEKIMKSFEKDVQYLETNKEKRYFKGSKDLIESVTSSFRDDGDFSISFEWVTNAKDDTEKLDFVDGLVKDYLDVLEATVDLYEEIQEFIDSIEKKRIIKFIRMVD
ncbi:hypothetical protein [Peribacillus simplex]|uniref:hypothetical protein n=1 Tax=Peribacillus simplex TaxID=1478 RepID=UPI003D2CE877